MLADQQVIDALATAEVPDCRQLPGGAPGGAPGAARRSTLVAEHGVGGPARGLAPGAGFLATQACYMLVWLRLAGGLEVRGDVGAG